MKSRSETIEDDAATAVSEQQSANKTTIIQVATRSKMPRLEPSQATDVESDVCQLRQ